MWTPDRFREESLGALHSLMQRFDFALLIRPALPAPFLTHIPFLLDPDRGPKGTLVGHLARANPHAEHLAGEALVVFQGPHAYVSPSWYQDQSTVPTWNYAVVHVRGVAESFREPERLRSIVERLTEVHEQRVGSSWKLGAALDRELSGIVGFDIPIRTLEGKFKLTPMLNQNRSAADRRGVIRALARSEDPLERGVAELMVGTLDPERGKGTGQDGP
jgi:transcriptional regulator